MRAIVTGASGFVGTSVVKELIRNNIEVLAVDINPPKIKNSILSFQKLSVENIDELKKLNITGKYDLFYHFAWLGSSGPDRMNEEIQLTNALWTSNSLKVADELGCKKFIVAGTIMEFETFEAIYAQSNEPSLPYIYGAGKSIAHMICKPIANSLNIDLVWTYITNAYGIGEFSPRLINSTIRKIHNNEKLEFSAGTQNYDFIYIDDVARAFHLIGVNGKPNKGYLIGSSEAQPLKNFLVRLINVLNKNAEVSFGAKPFTGVDLGLEKFDTKITENDTGFKATISFEEGITKTSDWLKGVDL